MFKNLQCKHIPELPILEFIGNVDRKEWPLGASIFWDDDFKPANSVFWSMPERTPKNLGVAKMKMLLRSGLVLGCGCGCRGDFTLSEKGLSFIKAARSAETSKDD